MTKDRYGAAVHEAGHAVVAWALGLEVGRLAIGINDDPSAGRAWIEEDLHLPLIDQIAICSAGADAQDLLDAETNEVAAMSDMVKIDNLLDDMDNDEADTVRFAGYQRSADLLAEHRTKLERLAKALAERGELDAEAIGQILKPDVG